MIQGSFCPVTGETLKEERINYWTHLIGLILSMFGFAILLYCSAIKGEYMSIVSCTIYGTTLILLYAASTFYHGCKTVGHKRILKIFDHICIYLLIAGSFTPYALGPLRGYGGINLLCLEWSIAAVGIAFKIVAIHRFKVLSTIAYLAMGWLIMFNLSAMIEALPPTSLYLLIVGGLSYTVGTIFYVWDSLPYNHGIWHVFVLGGSVSHYLSIVEVVNN